MGLVGSERPAYVLRASPYLVNAAVHDTLLVMTDEHAPDPQDLRRRVEQARRDHDTHDTLPHQDEADEAAPDIGPHKTSEALDTITEDSAP